MHKKILPFIFSTLCLVLIILLWDKITISYDNTNKIIGEYYFKKFNPYNDYLRFIIIFTLPLLTYLILYLKFNKDTYSLIKKEKFFLFEKKIEKSKLESISNKYYYLILFVTFIELILLDFQKISFSMDIYHDGTFLTPPLNALKSDNFLLSTFHDYGLIANNLGLMFYKIFGFYNLSSIKLINIIIIFFIKVLLITIGRQVTSYLDLKKNYKELFFIIFSLILIGLPDYYDMTSYFPVRSFLLLFFIYFVGIQLNKNLKYNIYFILVGVFSSISVIWWFDIGFYINFTILALTIILFIKSETKNILFIFFGVLISWIIFLIFLSENEIKEFFFQAKTIYSTDWQYLLGLEYKKPFSTNSTRWTKALLIIYLTSLMLVNFNFDIKLNIKDKLKIFLNLIFIAGLVNFISALTRSDAPHIKYSSGLYTFCFIFLLLFNLFIFLEKKKFKIINYKYFNKLICLFFIITHILYFADMRSDQTFLKKISRVSKIKDNIILSLGKDEIKYLNTKNTRILDSYKYLNKNDFCLQILTDDLWLYYFQKKISCTQFYNPAMILNSKTENKFIFQLKKNTPSIILFNSDFKILSNHNNMPMVIEYINKNYEYFKSFKGYIFYKKKLL